LIAGLAKGTFIVWSHSSYWFYSDFRDCSDLRDSCREKKLVVGGFDARHSSSVVKPLALASRSLKRSLEWEGA
jgi:hypothetical protein